MSMYSNRLKPALQIVLQRVVRCCSILPPEIVMHDAYIGRRSQNNIKCVVHDDLGWKNWTTRYNCMFSGFTSDFLKFHSCGTYLVLSRSPSTIFL